MSGSHRQHRDNPNFKSKMYLKNHMKEISILGSDQKANLRIVLNYVEKYNKQDEDMQVAQACAYLEELLKDK